MAAVVAVATVRVAARIVPVATATKPPTANKELLNHGTPIFPPPQELPLRRHGYIGRASCRERVCHYVYISVVSVSLHINPSLFFIFFFLFIFSLYSFSFF